MSVRVPRGQASRMGLKSYSARPSAAQRSLAQRLSIPVSQRRTPNQFKPGALARAPGASPDVGFVDLASAVYALNTTGSITLLATIAQGASVNQRIGKKILLKSIEGRGAVTSDSTTTVAYGRVMIVYDKRPTGALPAITDILDTIHPNSFNNDTNSGRFLILKSQIFTCAGNNTTAGQINDSSVQDASFYLKLTKKDLRMVFKAAATGAIGDIEMGALYLITCGNVVAGTADCNLSAGFRTRFYDV